MIASHLYEPPVCRIKPGELNCPCCKEHFTSDFAFDEEGKLSLEANSFRDPTLIYTVHSCPFCCFSGTYDSFNGSTSVSRRARKFVREDLIYMIDGPEGVSYASGRYYAAALIAARRKEPASAIGQLYLNAARCCVVKGDRPEDEGKYRKGAIKYFAIAVNENLVARRCIPFHCIVIAEQYCRIGQQREWREWRQKARSEAEPSQLEEVIALIAKERYKPFLIPEEDYIFQKTDTPCCS